MPEVGAGGVSMSSTVTTETAYGQASGAGSSSNASRGDHTHGTVVITRDLSVNDASIGFRSNQAGAGDALVGQGGVNSLHCKTAAGATEFRVLTGDSVRAYRVIDAYQGLTTSGDNKNIVMGSAAAHGNAIGCYYTIAGVANLYDAMVFSTGTDNAAAAATTANSALVLGIYGVDVWGTPFVARRGKHLVNVLTATVVARGDILVTSTTAGYAGVNNGATRDQWLGRALTAKAGGTAGTVMCEIMAG